MIGSSLVIAYMHVYVRVSISIQIGMCRHSKYACICGGKYICIGIHHQVMLKACSSLTKSHDNLSVDVFSHQ